MLQVSKNEIDVILDKIYDGVTPKDLQDKDIPQTTKIAVYALHDLNTDKRIAPQLLQKLSQVIDLSDNSDIISVANTLNDRNFEDVIYHRLTRLDKQPDVNDNYAKEYGEIVADFEAEMAENEVFLDEDEAQRVTSIIVRSSDRYLTEDTIDDALRATAKKSHKQVDNRNARQAQAIHGEDFVKDDGFELTF